MAAFRRFCSGSRTSWLPSKDSRSVTPRRCSDPLPTLAVCTHTHKKRRHEEEVATLRTAHNTASKKLLLAGRAFFFMSESYQTRGTLFHPSIHAIPQSSRSQSHEQQQQRAFFLLLLLRRSGGSWRGRRGCCRRGQHQWKQQ